MVIVLDTNEIVSALLTETGAPAQVLDLCITGDLELAVDARIVAEYDEVLSRPEFAFEPGEVQRIMELIVRAEHVTAAPVPVRLSDPDDAPFLEVAVAAAADAIVTGNVRHFKPAAALDIAILTPRTLLERLGS